MASLTADTHSNEERKRALPSHLVVCLVIAMSLWSKASMRTVLKNLVDGLSEVWVRVGQYWRVPCKSSITEARQRIGCGVITRLFHLVVVRPLATAQTPGAFLGEMRVIAVDGTVFDVPDTQANARVFGYPGTRPGTRAAFPKVRLVLLIEAGTHLIVDALDFLHKSGKGEGGRGKSSVSSFSPLTFTLFPKSAKSTFARGLLFSR